MIGCGFGTRAGLDRWSEEVHVHANHSEKRPIVVGVPADHEDARRVLAESAAEAVRG